MIALGFNEFLRNLKRNILVVIQMVAVYIIVIFTVSAFEEQYRLMDGISNIFDDTGMILFRNGITSDEYITLDVLEENLIKVENIDYGINFNILDPDFEKVSDPEFTIHISSSNPKHISYKPELIMGEWCEEAKHEEGVINAVASNNMPFDVHIGEIIEYGDYVFKITGIVETKEMIYGINNSFKYTEASYLDYYAPIYSRNTMSPYCLFIVSYNDLMKYDSYEYDVASLWSIFTTVDFEDDITDEEIKYNMEQMTERYGYSEGVEMFLTADMYNYSWELIMIKIMPMVMLLIVIIIVLIVSLIISGAINILYERKNYGIYFICGNDWKNTFKFSLVNWAITAFTSIVIAGCACVYIYSAQMFDGLILSFTTMHIYALVAITVAMLIITTIIPFIMLRKIQPVSILKENDK